MTLFICFSSLRQRHGIALLLHNEIHKLIKALKYIMCGVKFIYEPISYDSRGPQRASERKQK